MLPNGWKLGDFGSIGKWTGGGTPSKANDSFWMGGTIPWVSPKDMTSGKICDTEDYITPEAIKNSATRLYPSGSVMIVTRSGILRKKLPVAIAESPVTVNQDLKVLPYDKQFSPEYVYNYILCFNSEILNVCAKDGTTVESIDTNSFLNFPVKLPPLPEQKKIAAILSTWDRAIEGMEKLLANSQQQKKALMQQLLTGKKRLPGFSGEWKNYTLENILNVRKEKSLPSNKIPLFSLTIDGGITSKTDRYNREFLVKNKNEKKYKVVYPRDLVYNPANLRWGAINYSRIPHKVVVSPIYEVLYVNNIERFFPDLIYQYLMSPFQIEKFSSMIEGTLMERKAVKISPFLATKIRIPCDFSEQQAIAAVLSTADEEITTLESDLARLRQEKKALMQQLLTGKRRVKVD